MNASLSDIVDTVLTVRRCVVLTGSLVNASLSDIVDTVLTV